MVAIHTTRRRRNARRRRGSGLVYLVHFKQPYHHARHYVGYTKDVAQRIAEHRAGHGSRLLAAVAAAGVGFDVAFTWKRASRTFERNVHRCKNTPRLCPICAGSDRRARAYAPRNPAAPEPADS